jgi:hypothetical protein
MFARDQRRGLTLPAVQGLQQGATGVPQARIAPVREVWIASFIGSLPYRKASSNCDMLHMGGSIWFLFAMLYDLAQLNYSVPQFGTPLYGRCA